MNPLRASTPPSARRCSAAFKILARKHGKAVLLCTHILPDVQAVSDAVVILAKSRVRVADRLETLEPADGTVAANSDSR